MTNGPTPQPDTLIAALLGPPGPELTCEECFDRIDRYVDLAVAGIDPDEAVPGMLAHLSGCPACRDDHESLLHYVRRAGGDPPPARG